MCDREPDAGLRGEAAGGGVAQEDAVVDLASGHPPLSGGTGLADEKRAAVGGGGEDGDFDAYRGSLAIRWWKGAVGSA
ncbi:hypothetical protein SSCG_03674 [Streptomyces clavuligerus]|nr:hypothetical protein SSCG_03674 [Streptomyces clavuligerus]